MNAYLSNIYLSSSHAFVQTKTFLCRKSSYVASAIGGMLPVITATYLGKDSIENPSILKVGALAASVLMGALSLWLSHNRLREEQRLIKVQKETSEYIRPEDPKNAETTALVCLAEADYNGAFEHFPWGDTHCRLYTHSQVILIWSCGVDDLVAQVEIAKQRALHPITTFLVGGHGSDASLALGDSLGAYFGSVLSAKDLIRVCKLLPDLKDLIADSCCTGTRGGLCEQTARGLKGVRVYGSSTSVPSTIKYTRGAGSAFDSLEICFNATTGHNAVCFFNSSNEDVTEVYDENGPVFNSLADPGMEKAVESSGYSPRFAFRMGTYYKQQGDYQIAHAWFMKSHKQDKTLGGKLQADQLEELIKEANQTEAAS